MKLEKPGTVGQRSANPTLLPLPFLPHILSLSVSLGGE